VEGSDDQGDDTQSVNPTAGGTTIRLDGRTEEKVISWTVCDSGCLPEPNRDGNAQGSDDLPRPDIEIDSGR
jgi:hypothetical protein